MEYYEKITDIWEQFIGDLIGIGKVQSRESITKQQILLVLSLQKGIYKEGNHWYVHNKKKKGWRLDFKKFKKKVFEEIEFSPKTRQN